jgi:subtilisin family serine protease
VRLIRKAIMRRYGVDYQTADRVIDWLYEQYEETYRKPREDEDRPFLDFLMWLAKIIAENPEIIGIIIGLLGESQTIRAAIPIINADSLVSINSLELSKQIESLPLSLDEIAERDGEAIYSIPPDWRPSNATHEPMAAEYPYWHLPRDPWESIHNRATGKGVVIANLDTGILDGHRDLKKPLASQSFTSGHALRDRNGHGTHCSGTNCGNDPSITCAPEANLIVGKVLSDSGSGGSDGIARGIRWAADEGAHVISMSLGGPSAYGPTRDAINYAMSKGAVVVAAAGNSGYSGRNTIGYPAKFDGAICIGATRSDGSIATFSSGGRELDFATPGQQIASASISSRTARTYMSGTSMATPFAASLFALVIELRHREGAPMLTSADEWRSYLSRFTTDKGQPGKDPIYGYGVPSYAELVTALNNESITFA